MFPVVIGDWGGGEVCLWSKAAEDSELKMTRDNSIGERQF